jgi:FkbM family methyltransferase
MNIEQAVKQRLVGNAVGSLLEGVRERWDRARAPCTTVGTLANDQLALQLVVHLARGSGVFLDVGAHIGSVFSRVVKASPETQVIAIEAMPDKVAWLRRRYPTVTVHHCAAGEAAREVSFYTRPEQSGYSSLANADGAIEIKVQMRPLDELVPHADVVKVDVEGAELGAVRGMPRLLAQSRPVVMFESAPGAGEKLGYPLADMFAFWRACDYGLFIPNRIAHTGPPLVLDSFVEAHDFPRRTTNYFAIPLEKVTTVRESARGIVGVA